MSIRDQAEQLFEELDKKNPAAKMSTEEMKVEITVCLARISFLTGVGAWTHYDWYSQPFDYVSEGTQLAQAKMRSLMYAAMRFGSDD